jgi:hypothetical protein
MRIYGGLERNDWLHWGQHTTFKTNAAALLVNKIRSDQIIYCSPLVDPYQPAETQQRLMPEVLAVLAAHPPARFVIQTRSPLVLRDLDALRRVPNLAVSFSVTTDRSAVLRRYEPHCPSFAERLQAIRTLNAAGIPAFATLAPLLPCDPEELVEQVCAVTDLPLVGDPLHIRATKPTGATTRDAAYAIARHHGELDWFSPAFQRGLVDRITAAARARGREFAIGPAGFSLLARGPG